MALAVNNDPIAPLVFCQPDFLALLRVAKAATMMAVPFFEDPTYTLESLAKQLVSFKHQQLTFTTLFCSPCLCFLKA